MVQVLPHITKLTDRQRVSCRQGSVAFGKTDLGFEMESQFWHPQGRAKDLRLPHMITDMVYHWLTTLWDYTSDIKMANLSEKFAWV
jgi:hypothetical protein